MKERITETMGIFEEEEAQEKEDRRARQQEKRIDAAFKSVMETKSGRTAIAWILSITGESHSVTDMDPMAMMFRSARRDVGLTIRERILSAGLSEQYELMQKEANNV